MTIHILQLVATVNKTDETGTLFFNKCLILPLTFLRLGHPFSFPLLSNALPDFESVGKEKKESPEKNGEEVNTWEA